MPTIKTCKPSGGGDYTTLQAWWDDVKTAGSADQWIECYEGDLGTVSLSGHTFTPDATNYVKIYAASNAKHNGLRGSTNGARIASSSGNGLISACQYTRIEGIRFVVGGGTGILIINGGGGTIDSCYFQATANYLHFFRLQGNDLITIVKNCIGDSNIYDASSHIFNFLPGNEEDFANECYNCTIYHDTLTGIGHCYNQTNTTIVTNCIAIKGNANMHSMNSTSFCATNDAEPVGTGNLLNQSATDLMVDPSNGNFTLKSGSNAINAGTSTSPDVTTDILGVARPIGSTYDIGAFESSYGAITRILKSGKLLLGIG